MDLQSILDSDEDGLLDEPVKAKKVTSSDRLERSFLEIVEFYREHDRIPSSTTREIAERKLGARLDGILANDEKIEALRHLDEFGLLSEPEAPASLDDLLDGDADDLLDDASGILDTSALPPRKQRHDPDEIARRTRADDFDQFEPLFLQKHEELRSGAARLIPGPGYQHITEGAFIVLNGAMLFVAEVGDPEYRTTTVRSNRRERLRVIFENGTESNMYRQSLGIRLGEGDSYLVARADGDEILADDEATGWIYVLRSKSEDPQIAGRSNLCKIGFTTGSVEKRIAGAEKAPTYLMAPVEVVATYRTYNMKTSTLEHLLHRLFADVRLDISQAGIDGRIYEPSEWFEVPLEVIDQAAAMIASGEIVGFVYDATSEKLVNTDDAG